MTKQEIDGLINDAMNLHLKVRGLLDTERNPTTLKALYRTLANTADVHGALVAAKFAGPLAAEPVPEPPPHREWRPEDCYSNDVTIVTGKD